MKIERDLQSLKTAKQFGITDYIHTLILYNTYDKISILQNQILSNYNHANAILRYLTKMMDMQPKWFQFRKIKKFKYKYKIHFDMYKKYKNDISKLDIRLTREMKSIKH